MRTSIRRRVLLSFLAILTTGTAAVCIATYLGIRHELDELYDANMRQLARTVSSMPIDSVTANSSFSFSEEMPHGEEIFLVQIWENGKLEYSSHPAADFPLQNNEGHGAVFFRGKKWGYYQEDISGHVVQVSQELYFRRDVIREVYNAIIIPILIQFPLLGALVWLFVGFGFRPLDRISFLIETRTANFMAPISQDDTPQELSVLIGALNDLLRRLQSSLDAQRQFTADAAHELRTPLTAVRLQVDLLSRAQTELERDEAIRTLDRGVARSIHLVQQLLELARQEPDSVTDAMQSFEIDALIRNVVQDHLLSISQKGIKLDLKLEPVMVLGERASIAVLLGNLLSNAINYTPQNGRIIISAHRRDGDAIISVSDNGVGIPTSEQARIFDRFYRVVGNETPGSGLGLAIVKNIADRHQAKVSITSGMDGRGTTLTVIFPDLEQSDFS